MTTEHDSLRAALKAELSRRQAEGKMLSIDRFKPYTNKDGTKSWQTQLIEGLENSDLFEIIVCAANSSGKSFCLALIIAQILYGKSKFNLLFDEPVWVHVVCKSFSTQKDTVQKELAKITDSEISVYKEETGKQKFTILSHLGCIKEIYNRVNRVRITFGSAENGAKGNVGVRPHLLLCDEPIDKALYQELVVRTTTKNAKFITCGTVIDAEHAWVMLNAQEIIKDKTPGKLVITAPMVQNPYVPDTVIEHFKRTFGENTPAFRVRVMGSLEVVTGVVYEGIEQCVVHNTYIPQEFTGLSIEQQEKRYIWAESADFGISAKDPTIIGFFKIWANGEIVQEDEICLYEKRVDDWIDEWHKKREELDMPLLMEGYPHRTWSYDRKIEEIWDPELKRKGEKITGTGLRVRIPALCVGDKQYLARKSSMSSSTRLKQELALRKIYIAPSLGAAVEDSLPVVQNLVKNQNLKVKERCQFSLKFAKSYVVKTSENSGKVSYDTCENHWSDIMRYLVEKIGNANVFIKSISDNLEFTKRSSIGSIVSNDVKRQRI